MYLNKFCFVLVLVTVSASYFDEELPLYLSDDILISKLPGIAKRSVLNSPRTELQEPIEERGDQENKNYEVENEEESGLVFLPSFGRRNRRSVSKNDEKIVKRDTTEEKNPKNSNTGINEKKGEGKEIENGEESGLVFLPSFGRRSRRSVTEKDGKDLLNSESNIVFLPSFKRKGFRRFRRNADATHYRQLFKRSTETLNEPEENKKQSVVTEKNEELSDSDAVNGEESGLVFLPSFGRRSRRNVADGSTASTERNSQKDTSTSRPTEDRNKPQVQKTKREVDKDHLEKKKTELNGSDKDSKDELEEESGLVFLPSFGRRSRRNVVQRSPSSTTPKERNLQKDTTTSRPTEDKNKPQAQKTKREVDKDHLEKKKTELNSSDKDPKDELEEESGLVFLPSFGRRSRRNVVERSPSSTTPKELNLQKDTSTSRPTEDKNKPQVQKTKREVDKDHLEKKKSELNGSDKDSKDELEEESGLVFLPSFGRRSRRNVVERSPSSTTPKISTLSSVNGKHDQKHPLVSSAEKVKREVKKDDTEKKESKVDGINNEDPNDESLDESGLVFLPSFGRRSRRSIEESSSSSTEQTTSTKVPQVEKKSEKNQKTKDSHDEAEEESGLVFLPSFGRRHRRDVPSTSASTKKEEVTTASTNVKDEVQTRKTLVVQESGLVFLPSFNRRT